MNNNSEMLCGMYVKSLARIVAIVGLILSSCSLLFNIFSWLFLPMSISLIIAFILVLIGISNSRPKLLFIAIILIKINVAIEMVITAFAIILGITVTQSNVDYVNNNSYNTTFTKSELRVGFFVVAGGCIVIVVLLIFAMTTFHLAHQHLIKHSRPCAVVYNWAPSPPPPAYVYGTNCPAPGFAPNSPATTSIVFQTRFTNEGYQQQQQFNSTQSEQQPPNYDSNQFSMWNNPAPVQQQHFNAAINHPTENLNPTSSFTKY